MSISWMAAHVVASQEGLCSVIWDSVVCQELEYRRMIIATSDTSSRVNKASMKYIKFRLMCDFSLAIPNRERKTCYILGKIITDNVLITLLEEITSRYFTFNNIQYNSNCYSITY
jgi:hypothetical protein